MPAIQPISLVIGEDTEVYNPSASSGNQTTFVDTTASRLAEWRTIRVTTRPAAAGNSGHVSEHLLVRPIPVADQAGCCVDKDNAPASTVTIRVLLNKAGDSAQGQDLVDMIRAYVETTAFEAIVKGSSYY